MELIFLGDFIRCRREDLGLTQRQLCEGICEPMTISRIERGEQTPRHNTVIALLERLGAPYDRYFTLLSKDELKLAALQREITSASIQFQQEREPERSQAHTYALEKLAELERVREPDDNITLQYIQSARASLRTLEGSISPEEEIAALLEVIRITVPKFDLARIDQKLYTLEEIRIINQIAAAYSNCGDHKKAAGIFSQLHTYVKEHNQELTRSGGGLPLVAFNYARELDIRKHYEDALDIAAEGRAACVRYGHYQFLPGLIHIMAECHHFLGNDKESAFLYHRAYHLYQELQHERNCDILREDAKKQLNIDFP